MIIVGVDPGIRNCGVVVLENRKVLHWTAWTDFEGCYHYRSLMIAKTIQKFAEDYKADCVGWEEFFGGGIRAAMKAAANYSRGILDATARLVLSHIPFVYVNPVWLKKWVTGVGNRAAKHYVMEVLHDRLKKEQPCFYNHVMSVYPKANEHVFEAFVIAEIAMGLYLRQWMSLEHLLPSQREMLRYFEKRRKGETVIKPRLSYPIDFPLEMLREGDES